MDRPGLDNLGKGFAAGFIASAVLAAVMLFQKAASIMPELDVIGLQSQFMVEFFGTPYTPMMGWSLHFLVGTLVWGGAFGAANHLIPGETEMGKGLVLGLFAWLVSMLGYMPLMGAGLFGQEIAAVVPLMSLVMHSLFGVVLGIIYASLLHISAIRPLPLARY